MTAKASEWREKGRAAAVAVAEPLLLPSGVTIMARRPLIEDLVIWGLLPLGLVSETGAPAGGGSTDLEDTKRLMRGWRDLMNYCCVKPRISLEPAGEDEIHPRDVPDADMKFIVRWAMREEETERLRPFRGERGDAGAGVDGVGIRAAAEQPGGDRGPGAGAGAGPGGDGGDPRSAEASAGIRMIAMI